MHKLGIIDRRKVHFFLQPAYPNYVRHGYRTAPSGAFRTKIAFAGNVYLEAARTLPFRQDPVFDGIETRVLAAKKSRLNECLWDLIMGEIGALTHGQRSASVIAKAPTTVIFIRAQDFRHFANELPALGARIRGVVEGRMRSLDGGP